MKRTVKKVFDRAARRPPVNEPPAADRAAAPRPEKPRTLDSMIASGVPFGQAVVRYVRSTLKDKDVDRARALAFSLRDAGEPIGTVASGIVAFDRGDLVLAWSELSQVTTELWAVHAPREFVRSGTALCRDEVVDRIAEAAGLSLPPASWFPMVEALLALDEPELAQRVFARLDDALGQEATEADRVHRDWLADWVGLRPDAKVAPRAEEGVIDFAITDYRHPDRTLASRNIGDHVQSIAAAGHLARHTGVEYLGDPDLAGFFEELRERVDPAREVTRSRARVRVSTVDRDASSYQAIAPDTWMLGFGWFMHPIFGGGFDLPLHPNLRPIFVSFHCNKRRLLTPWAVDYLKKYGPIGCRDWTTVDILQSLGVPAFFSGCVTTTISTVFPPLTQEEATRDREDHVAYVNVKDAPDGARTYVQSGEQVRFRPFTRNCRDAIEIFETYRRRHRALVTTRLHCYLPARSIGMDVDFVHPTPGEIRFNGLHPLDDTQFEAIRGRILDLLEGVFEEILSGTPVEAVYAKWRELTSDLVAEAESRRAEPAEETKAPALPPAVISRHGASDSKEVVVIRAAGAGDKGVATLISSIETHASRPVEIVVVDRRGATNPVLGLPDLLDHASRAVVLSSHSLVTGDVADLLDLDLGDHLLAAPDRIGDRRPSGFDRLHAAANRLGEEPEKAFELRRVGYVRFAYDFVALRSEVLVLDLERWRAADLGPRLEGVMGHYGMNLDEALMFELGPNRVSVPPAWAFVPTRMPESAEPGLVCWPGKSKPWSERYVPQRARWRAAASSVSETQPWDRSL